MIDYTKIPRQLIYKDLDDINNFGINDKSRLESKFYWKLLERSFIKNKEHFEHIGDVSNLVLQIFNNAYYICTLIYLEEHTEMHIDDYLGKTIEFHERSLLWNNRVKPITMALVYSLLKRNKYSHTYLLNEIDKRFANWEGEDCIEGKKSFYEMIIDANEAGSNNTDKTQLPDFAPRTITHKAINEAFSREDETKTWRYLTDDYNPDKIIEVFAKLGRTKEEKETMRQSLRYDVGTFCDSGQKTRILAQIDGMDFSSNENAIELGMESRYAQVIFENQLLLQKIDFLKQQQKELLNSNSPSTISQTEDSSESTQIIDKLKNEINNLKEQLKDFSSWEYENVNYETLSKQNSTTAHHKIVFFLTIFGVCLDEETKKFYNQKELANVISCMAKENPNTIGPMISRIIQAKKRINKKRGSEQDKKLMITLATIAQSLSDKLGNIMLESTCNDKTQKINKIKNDLILEYPMSEND